MIADWLSALAGVGGLPIGPHQVRRMMLGDETHFARRLPCLVDHKFGNDGAELGERVAQDETGLVIADEADKDARRAQRGDVARHVAGAADLDGIVLDPQHRGRRFRRDACDFAVDEVIKHHIADAENGLLGNEPQRFLKIEHARSGPVIPVQRKRSARSR